MNRSDTADNSADPESLLPLHLGVIIRAVGDRALFDDLVLTPNVVSRKDHGPRSAIYTALNLSNGVLLSAARYHASAQPEDDMLSDRSRIADAIYENAGRHTILDRETFGLVHSISVVGAFPGYRKPLPSASIEIRQTPDGVDYVSMAVPTYMRTAPEFIARYIQGMRQLGRYDYDEALEDIAYQNDNRKVAKLLASNVLYYVQKDYEEHDKLEAEFAND